MENEKKNLIVFGYGLAIIFAFVSFKVWREHGWHLAHIVLFVCVFVLIIMTKFRHDLLRPIYKRWMQVAHLIGNIITGFILSILFFIVFGAVGIILRLLRKDLLDRRMNGDANSYWIKKSQVIFDKNHYLRQF